MKNAKVISRILYFDTHLSRPIVTEGLEHHPLPTRREARWLASPGVYQGLIVTYELPLWANVSALPSTRSGLLVSAALSMLCALWICHTTEVVNFLDSRQVGMRCPDFPPHLLLGHRAFVRATSHKKWGVCLPLLIHYTFLFCYLKASSILGFK